MPRLAWMPVAWLAALVLVTGCADNPMVLRGQVQTLEQQQLAMSRQNREMQDRAAALDRTNQQLDAQLAQAQQQNQVLKDQLAVTRDQLSSVSNQLAQTRDQKQVADARTQALQASMQRQGGVTINPNNSLDQAMPAINLPGIQTRRDGDVVRVEIPISQIIDPASGQLRANAVAIVTTITSELTRTYPGHMIGVEGHTDNDPLPPSQYRSHHELSMAWAGMVYELVLNQARVPANQLFVAAHGANHPVVSNATPQGKERNRRVELVVYPDMAK